MCGDCKSNLTQKGVYVKKGIFYPLLVALCVMACICAAVCPQYITQLQENIEENTGIRRLLLQQITTDDEFSILEYYNKLSHNEKINLIGEYMASFRKDGFEAAPHVPMQVNHVLGDEHYEKDLWEDIRKHTLH